MYLTDNEKKAILLSIALVINADDEIAPEESRFFTEEMRKYGITSSQFASYQSSLNKSEWVRTINSMDDEKIEYMVSRWIAVIKADGKIRREEIDFAGLMATECELDLRKYIKAAFL